MSYTIAPGIYAIGNPDENSEVLATANYKLTIDTLRAQLAGLNLWLLVLDTNGINVWCAAGKGTFGTEELSRRLYFLKQLNIIRHSRVIVPQLGAPGVAAHQVKQYTGFTVIYGPVRAADIPRFLRNNRIVDEKMRRVTFSLRARIVFLPIELRPVLRKLPHLVALSLFLSAIHPGPWLFDSVLHEAV
jgi:CO dehydrogenase/acetyl-CoA synthase gamma subunit (corrinoid Fe-S protein)